MNRPALTTVVLAVLASACTREAEIRGIYTNLNGDAELFPCDQANAEWKVVSADLASTSAKLGGVRMYIRVYGTRVDSGSIYGSRHTFTVRQVLEARAAKPGECRPESELPALAAPIPAGDPVPAPLASDLTDFVQRFYDWYVPKLTNGEISAAWDVNLRHRAGTIDSTLLRALVADGNAAARDQDNVVGLDFDPFVASQDPCDTYKAGAASKHADQYWVEVFGVCDNKKHTQPDVVAELERRQGFWVFVNFRYPDGDDLVKTLQTLVAERKQRAQPPRAAR